MAWYGVVKIMKVHYSKFPMILARLLDEVVAPKSETWQMVVYSLALYRYQDSILEMTKAFADKDGFIDMDMLRDTLNKSFDKWGNGKCPIPYIKWVADKDDIATLYKIAESEAKDYAR